jgi:hypothetical protein
MGTKQASWRTARIASRMAVLAMRKLGVSRARLYHLREKYGLAGDLPAQEWRNETSGNSQSSSRRHVKVTVSTRLFDRLENSPPIRRARRANHPWRP